MSSDGPMVRVATDLSLAFANSVNYITWDYVPIAVSRVLFSLYIIIVEFIITK